MAGWPIAYLENVGKDPKASNGSASPDTGYEPVYGLSRRAVQEWLAQSPTQRGV